MKINDFCTTRRSILVALPGIALIPGVLSACSSTDKSADIATSAPTKTSATDKKTGIPASSISIGTAQIVDFLGSKYVVAQPESGKFVAFSAACTHEGVTVRVEEGLTLDCPAHQSDFNAATGAVLKGPATQPLTSVKISNNDGTLILSP